MTQNTLRIAIFAALAVAFVLVAGWWWSATRAPASVVAHDAIRVASPALIDPANDEHRVSVSGMLEIDAGAIDNELDIGSAAAILFRDVEMYQWQEQCVANGCGQSAVWSDMRIDSSTFHEQSGNTNPDGFPFANARFAAHPIRIGAYTIDPDLVAALPATPRPVLASELPPNLAAIFSDDAGGLYSGDDAQRPGIGDLRVRYRIVPVGQVTLTGVQRGDHLVMRTDTH